MLPLNFFYYEGFFLSQILHFKLKFFGKENNFRQRRLRSLKILILHTHFRKWGIFSLKFCIFGIKFEFSCRLKFAPWPPSLCHWWVAMCRAGVGPGGRLLIQWTDFIRTSLTTRNDPTTVRRCVNASDTLIEIYGVYERTSSCWDGQRHCLIRTLANQWAGVWDQNVWPNDPQRLHRH